MGAVQAAGLVHLGTLLHAGNLFGTLSMEIAAKQRHSTVARPAPQLLRLIQTSTYSDIRKNESCAALELDQIDPSSEHIKNTETFMLKNNNFLQI